MVRAPAKVAVRGSIGGVAHTPPETWATTRSKTLALGAVATLG